MAETILDVRALTVDLPPWADRPQAVSDFSLALRHDEILWGRRFAPAFFVDQEGALVLEVSKVGEIA